MMILLFILDKMDSHNKMSEKDMTEIKFSIDIDKECWELCQKVNQLEEEDENINSERIEKINKKIAKLEILKEILNKRVKKILKKGQHYLVLAFF